MCLLHPNTLFIIGNGFDLFHGLRTSYSDFEQFISRERIYEEFGEFFDIKTNGDRLWNNFENDLHTISPGKMVEYYKEFDVLDEDFRPSFIYSLEDELSERVEHLPTEISNKLAEWIRALPQPKTADLERSKKLLKLGLNAKFISFNYTSTLTSIYNINRKNIYYIHGNAEETDELIFGHGVENCLYPVPPIFDESNEPTRHFYSDSEDAARGLFNLLKKPVEDVLPKLKSHCEGIGKIDNIIVLGHSLGDVDLQYFQFLRTFFPEATWALSYYNKADLNRIKQFKKIIDFPGKLKIIKVFAIN